MCLSPKSCCSTKMRMYSLSTVLKQGELKLSLVFIILKPTQSKLQEKTIIHWCRSELKLGRYPPISLLQGENWHTEVIMVTGSNFFLFDSLEVIGTCKHTYILYWLSLLRLFKDNNFNLNKYINKDKITTIKMYLRPLKIIYSYT